ncbi:hypothetical protein B0T20DRAFT_467820 [Sordaria brevicollis]|uniref:Uncharacterized protein n=1 Tax=Sordaria brevicollis TaxID=83679 RepID=A0AAE0UEC5_SORBR|nr:hypothetical protein B0T20DRAFT_467820 [Sordaria brevicollis]
MPASMSKPYSLQKLPTEIRLMIYRELWTQLDSGIGGNPNTGSGSGSQDVLIDRANHQLSIITAIQNLTLSCRAIRSELVETFFTKVLPSTQFHLPNTYAPDHIRSLRQHHRPQVPRPPELSPINLINFKIFQVLRSSSLFTQHIQHICIYWDRCYCSQDRQYQIRPTWDVEPDGLLWLANLEQLKTFRVVFTDMNVSRNLRFCYACRMALLLVPRTVEVASCWTNIPDGTAEDFALAEDRETSWVHWFWSKRALAWGHQRALEEMWENGEMKYGVEEDEVPPKRVSEHQKAIEENGVLAKRKDRLGQKIDRHIGGMGVPRRMFLKSV